MGSAPITASGLLLVDEKAEKIRPSDYDPNPAGFVIHSTIHDARPDVGAVVHTHTPAGVAVSAQKAGLLPISQQASVVLPSLGTHAYEGIALRDDERPRLAADLGTNTFLLLQNHGLLTVGRTVADAFLFMYALQSACEVQVLAQAGGTELVPIATPVLAGVEKNLDIVLKGMGGALAWPALLHHREAAYLQDGTPIQGFV